MKQKPGWVLPDLKEAQKRTTNTIDRIDTFNIPEAARMMGRGKKYFISTYGCQANERDSETLAGILDELGFAPNETAEGSDVIIINTCAIRQNAEEKVLGEIGNFKRLYRENKDLVIGVCGCMAQEEGLVETLLTKYPQVRLLFGTHNIQELPSMLYSCMVEGKKVVKIYSKEGEVYENLPVHRFGTFKAWVNIMYGCDKFCTYCIVPYVRGREKSREPKEIIREIERLVSDGVKEVMLLGQNVNSYGKTLDDNVTFAELLREIAKIDGLERIRFMTPHPKDLSDELIEAIRDNSKICNHIHLPLQSGSSRLLKLMNRQYTKEHYLELVDKIRNTIPDISITTDIIVGFPGETEEDFEDTLDVVRKAKYDSAYTFIYSKRTGTPAAKMDGQVSEDIVKDRFNRLLATVSEVSHEHIKRYEGMDMDVLVEDIDDHDNTFVTGRMTNNILVHFKGDKELIGSIVNVHLDECKGFYYMGTKND